MSDVFRESSVVAGGVRFHYATAGSGPLVLLLHGFPERWFSWRRQIPALAAAGYRVVAPDLRGYGLSDRPDGGYELLDLAQDVASLVAALGEDSAAVIGHDWGGTIAWEAASRHPDRVSRFAALNAPHPAVINRVVRTSWNQLVRSRYMLFFNIPWLPERVIAREGGRGVLRRFEGEGWTLPPDAVEALRSCLATPATVRPALEYYRRSVRRGLTGRLAPYPQIERPGLLLWSEADAVLGNELVAPHTRYARDLTIRRIAGCGHFMQQERADTVNAILIEWLGRTGSRLRG